jgi:hypothetical protein
MVTLIAREHDDSSFIVLVSRTLNGAILCYKPTEIYVVQIDNWFDHKWRAFSGKAVGAVGVWNTRLTVPPFEPNRVISQLHYRADEKKPETHVLQPAKDLHLHQWSSSNLQRFLKQFTESGLFIWYSGNTLNNSTGSLMVYSVGRGYELSWYASFKREGDWRVNKVQSISRRELLGLMKLSDAANGI